MRTRDEGWGRVADNENARSGEWALYDLANDRAEQHDLAEQRPEVVRELSATWEESKDRFIRDAGGRAEPTAGHFRYGSRLSMITDFHGC